MWKSTHHRSISQAMRSRKSLRSPIGAASRHADLVHRPGSPGSSFNGRLHDEFLNAWRFDTFFEALALVGDWRIDYQCNRPHTAHDDLTPREFAQAWIDQQQALA